MSLWVFFIKLLTENFMSSKLQYVFLKKIPTGFFKSRNGNFTLSATINGQKTFLLVLSKNKKKRKNGMERLKKARKISLTNCFHQSTQSHIPPFMHSHMHIQMYSHMHVQMQSHTATFSQPHSFYTFRMKLILNTSIEHFIWKFVFFWTTPEWVISTFQVFIKVTWKDGFVRNESLWWNELKM